MNLHLRFAIFCAKRCVHLWEAPKEVTKWLNKPRKRTALEVYYSTGWDVPSDEASQAAGDAASYAASYVVWPVEAPANAAYYHEAVQAASIALNISEEELRQEFVSTWSDKELSITDPSWIEYATVEILNREVAKQEKEIGYERKVRNILWKGVLAVVEGAKICYQVVGQSKG